MRFGRRCAAAFGGAIAMKWIAGGAAAIAMMSLASTAGAVTLNTGVGPPLGSGELNWTLTASPGSTNLTIVSGALDYPGAWVVAPVGSNWITPYAGGGTTATGEAPAGEYDYSLLNFANPHGSVTIRWSSDNDAKFYLNGNLLSSTALDGYASLVSFLIPAGSFGTTNTFKVVVQNDPFDGSNPTGLLVSADVSAVPLPAALPLFATGLGALGLLGWRRKRKAGAIAN